MSNAVAVGGIEYRADVEDLERFVEQGHRYVVALEQLLAEVGVRRGLVAAAIGYGIGPPDISTASCQELVAEAGINNAFVAGVSSSLQDLSAVAATVVGVRTPGFGGLISSGLAVDGTDLALGEDRALLAQIRGWPLLTAGVAAGAVDRLTADAKTNRAALTLLAAGVHPSTLSGASARRVVAVAARSEAKGVSHLDANHLDALLSDGYGLTLHRQIMAGEVEPPDTKTRTAVVDAMVAGLSPQDLGLAAAYFPAFYRRDVGLRAAIADAEQRREVADGSSWSWWDHDVAALARIDEELDRLHEQRRALVAEYAIGDDGAVEYFAATAATSDVTAGSSWEGQLYGTHFNGFHETKVSTGWFDGDRAWLKDPDGNSVELEHIGSRLAVDPKASVAFFNRIGVERTADLPTFLAGNHLGPSVFGAFGRGLAGASQITSAEGRPQLAFTGGALLEQPKRLTANGVIWYSPALLFSTGRFASRFLADATVAALRSAERSDEHAVNAFLGTRTVNAGEHATTVQFQGGEDPRNILLDRAAEDLEAVTRVIAALGGWTGDLIGGGVGDVIPSAESLDPLLRPSVPFQPSGARLEPRYWLDKLALGVVMADQDHPAISEAGHPTLTSPYPIAAFLAAAGEDDGLARTVLHTVAVAAQDAGGDEAVIRDPGTASGLDLLLARNVALLVPSAALTALGIAGSTLNAGAGSPIGSTEWRAVYEEVLRFGRGQAVAAGLDRLLGQALAGAVGEDAWFRSELAAPVARIAGRARAEAASALVTYSAGLDQLARDRNRAANLAASLAISSVGFLPMLGPAAAAGSASWSWFFDGYPTDNELHARIEQAKVSEWQRSVSWEDAIAGQYLRKVTGGSDPSGDSGAEPGVPGSSQLEMMIPGLGLSNVPVRRHTVGGDLTFRWQHPESGDWHRVPLPSHPDFETLFGSEPPGITTPLWLNIAESRDLIDDYRQDGAARPELDRWFGSRSSSDRTGG